MFLRYPYGAVVAISLNKSNKGQLNDPEDNIADDPMAH